MPRIHRRTVQKDLHIKENHEVVITHTHQEPDILECEVRWALGSITTNKASRGDGISGDGISGELLQILKDDAVNVLHSICQQIFKNSAVATGLEKSVFIPIPQNAQTTTQLHSSHMLVK